MRTICTKNCEHNEEVHIFEHHLASTTKEKRDSWPGKRIDHIITITEFTDQESMAVIRRKCSCDVWYKKTAFDQKSINLLTVTSTVH